MIVGGGVNPITGNTLPGYADQAEQENQRPQSQKTRGLLILTFGLSLIVVINGTRMPLVLEFHLTFLKV